MPATAPDTHISKADLRTLTEPVPRLGDMPRNAENSGDLRQLGCGVHISGLLDSCS